MAPVVRHEIPPKMGRHGTTITMEERKRKRNTLHSIIRRIVEGPLWTDDCKSTESDSHSTCTIESISPPTTPASSAVTGSDECDRLVRKRVERIPRRMSQLSVFPGMELVVPVKYNQRMARSFPDVQNRSERDKARRNKNTVSARESRAKMRLMNDLLQTEAGEARKLNVELKAGLASRMSYAMVLLEKLNLPPVDFLEMWQKANEMSDASSVDQQEAKCYLSGKLEPNTEDNKIEE
ncbi:uncharacterized protein LOC135709681 [Ochlerotatus camptorhynchus]|uniref:uncharacterized protein LOC135709681 n=1 Tax=Ochlerotatus camptorhynchus TaxID=644619 RepID=UPI0031D2157F